MSRRARLLQSGIMQHLFVVYLFSDSTAFISRMFAANCELCEKCRNIYREPLLLVEQLKFSGDPFFLQYHYVYMHSLFYSPRHCKRRSGSILNLLMFYNLIKSAVLPKSICDMSFYYEQVWRVRNWGFDIDFKVTSFRLNSDIFKSQGLGCRILKFFVICPQGAK